MRPIYTLRSPEIARKTDPGEPRRVQTTAHITVMDIRIPRFLYVLFRGKEHHPMSDRGFDLCCQDDLKPYDHFINWADDVEEDRLSVDSHNASITIFSDRKQFETMREQMDAADSDKDHSHDYSKDHCLCSHANSTILEYDPVLGIYGDPSFVGYDEIPEDESVKVDFNTSIAYCVCYIVHWITGEGDPQFEINFGKTHPKLPLNMPSFTFDENGDMVQVVSDYSEFFFGNYYIKSFDFLKATQTSLHIRSLDVVSTYEERSEKAEALGEEFNDKEIPDVQRYITLVSTAIYIQGLWRIKVAKCELDLLRMVNIFDALPDCGKYFKEAQNRWNRELYR